MLNSLLRSFTALNDTNDKEASENLHTFALLFPDAVAARRARLRTGAIDTPATNSTYDEDADDTLRLNGEKVRIIIAQDEARVGGGRGGRDILYDSRPAKVATEGSSSPPSKLARNAQNVASSTRRSPAKARGSSEENIAALKTPGAQGVGGSSTMKATRLSERKVSSDWVTPSPITSSNGWLSYARSQSDRKNRPLAADGQQRDEPTPSMDSKEEMESWLDCMFGKPGLAYRGPSTKLHILQRQCVHQPRTLGPALEMRSRSAQLIHFQQSGQLLLITRTFTVPLSSEETDGRTERGANAGQARRSSPKAPMYALAILIELPHNTSHDTVESVTQRWAVISRAMDALHDATESVIYARLSLRVDTVLAVRPWVPTPAEMSAPRRSRQGRWGFHAQSISPSFAGALSAPPITKLKPWALRHDETIMRAAEGATARIMQGLSILIVSTGQDRWGIWRDEVRVSNQWTGGKPKGTLFPIVLTAALSNHLRSLEAFVPCRYKKRFARKVRKIASWNSPALNRTVILTPDCNVGRRLVFLLSAFLPSLGASSQIAGPELETFSHAPTRGILSSSFFESPGPSQPLMYQEPSQLSIGTPSLEAANVQPATLNSVRPSVSSRRPSSSRSIKMSECLVPFGTAESRKSSATTNSTVSTPAIPIAHTRKPMTPSGSPGDRPGSSGSASINLLQRLQRNNSANLSTSSDSQSASKWGSLTSTWSTRPRRESSFTERSYAGTHLGSGEDALRSILKSGRDSTGRKAGHKLVRMVDEAQAINMPDRAEPDPCDSAMRTRDATPNSSRAVSDGSPSASPPSRLLPLCSTSSSSDPPFRLDCKPGEGVIDVELPAAALLPSNLTQPNPLLPFQPTDAISVGEPTSPPSPPSSPFPSAKNDHFARAAGYLETFHPDFALQAIRPRPSIEAEIREAMRSEPSPRVPRSIVTSDVGPIERSVDVCSSVLVDIAKGSVKRVLLRRRIRLTKIENKATRPLSGGSLAGNGSMVGPPRGPQEHMQSGKGTLLAGPPYPGHLRSPSIPQPHVHPVTADPPEDDAVTEEVLSEEFIEEPILSADETLSAATQRMLSESEQRFRKSSIGSQSSSRPSRGHSRSGSVNSSMMAQSQAQCKTIMMDALSEVITSVDCERTAPHLMETDSVLRQSIHKWLNDSD